MSRLTERDEYGGVGIIGVNSADLIRDLDYDEPDRVNDALNKLFALEDILCPADAPEITLDELREMCKAKREQRCVILPCKVGDTVWAVNESGCIDEFKVAYIYSAPDGTLCFQAECKNETEGCYCGSDAVCAIRFSEANMAQRKIYLTRAEAEAALAKKGEKK